MSPTSEITHDLTRKRTRPQRLAAPAADVPQRVTGRQLCAGIGLSAALSTAITLIARAAAPH
jgi:hypothetical protein